jgi:hypothetical protein
MTVGLMILALWYLIGAAVVAAWVRTRCAGQPLLRRATLVALWFIWLPGIFIREMIEDFRRA